MDRFINELRENVKIISKEKPATFEDIDSAAKFLLSRIKSEMLNKPHKNHHIYVEFALFALLNNGRFQYVQDSSFVYGREYMSGNMNDLRYFFTSLVQHCDLDGIQVSMSAGSAGKNIIQKLIWCSDRTSPNGMLSLALHSTIDPYIKFSIDI